MLETQAERTEGLEKCWQRARELAASIRRWRKQAEAEGSCAGWKYSVRRCSSTRRRFRSRKYSAAGERRAARVDIHLGDAVGEAAISPITPARWALNAELITAQSACGKARSISPRRRCCTCPRACRSRTARIYGSGGESRVAGDEGERRARIFAVHQPARDAACARTAAGGIRTRAARLSAVAAGRGLAHELLERFRDSATQC